MPDNLTFDIRADAKQAIAELAVVQNSLKSLRAENKAAAAEFAKTGDPAHLYTVSGAIADLNKQQVLLQKEVRATNKALGEQGGATKTLTQNFADFATAITPLGGVLSTFRAGLIGAGAAEAIKALGEAAVETARDVLRLQRVSAATGVDITTVQAFEELFKKAGAAAEDADKVLLNLQKGADQLSISLRNVGILAFSGVTTLRGSLNEANSDFTVLRGSTDKFIGSLTEVFRGTKLAKIEITDFASALRVIGIDAQKYLNLSVIDRAVLVQRALEAQAKAGRTDVAELASRAITGKGYREGAEPLRRATEGLAQGREDLEKGGLAVTAEQLKNSQALIEKLVEVQSHLEATAREALSAAVNFARAITDAYTDPKATEARHEAFVAGQNADVAAAQQLWGGFFSWFQQGWADAWHGAPDPSLRPTPRGRGQGPPTGQAAGGYIRGPGTGTSDSILARVSDGEFITRAAAVRHYGAGLFEALNQQRFEFGGLADAIHARPGRRSFADGGLVDDFDPSRYDFDPDKPIRRYRSARETPLRVDPRETPLRGSARETPLGGSARETPLRVDPRETPLGGYDTSRTATPVHLHIGGGEYPLSTSAAVARKLVAAARREQTASAGTMPSWYGG
jgi:hypothetical protein